MKKIAFSLSLCLSLLFVSFFLSAQDLCTPVGWVTQNGGVTGGGNATPVVVSNYTDLKAAITSASVKVVHVSGVITIPSAGRISFQDQSGKTIYGLPGSKLVSNDLSKDGSGIIYVKRCSNVIFKNLTFEGPAAYDTDGWDNMCLDNSTNIWVDHCEFQDGMDGNLDVKTASDFVSITWCKFTYLKAPIPGGSGGSDDHRFTNLFGSSDGATGDRGHLRVTLQNNWWAQGCKERMPRVRFGKVHLANNLFNSTASNKCIMAGFEADLLIESNVFENVKSPIDKMDNNFTAITAINNIFTNVTGNTTGSGTAFTPPYTLTITPAANVKSQVMAGAGATLTSPSCGPPPVTYTLSTTASPTAGGTVSGAGTYTSGSTVTVTATPASGYVFTGWSGDASGTATSVTVTMSGNKTVTANFQVGAPTTYTLTTTSSPSAGGSVTGAGTYNSGTIVSVTAMPNAGYIFTGWSGDASGTATSVNVTMSSNKAVTANFQVSGGGGTSTIRIEDDANSSTGLCLYEGSSSTNSGASNGKVLNLTNAIGKAMEWSVGSPAGGSYTLNWRYVNSSSSNTYSMKLVINGVTINTALPFPKTSSSTTFSNTTTIVTLNAGSNRIRLESTTSSATADIDWIEIIGDVPTAANCSGTPPVTYTLGTNSSPTAGGSVTGAGTYNSGTSVTVTATPAAGYTFTSWSGDATGTSASVNVTMNSNKTVTANFTAIPVTYTLVTSASPSAGGSVTSGGTYNSGTVVTITATPNAGYMFTGWSGDVTGTLTSVDVTMTANKNVVANFTPIIYALTTSASPLAGGSVTAGGTYNSGTVVTITATPNAGYAFTGWSGDASGTSTSVDVTMTADKNVVANFAPITYTLVTSASPSAGGSVTSGGTYTSGTVVTITATPNAGYTFTGWSGDASGTSTSVDVTMTADKNVVANFTPISYALSTTASPSAGGTVSGAGTYNSGTVVTLTATPAAGYTFTNWSGDASGTSASVNVTMNSNKVVTANFTVIPVTYTLSTAASPSAGGTVTGAGTYNSGTVVTLTATPAAGYTFANWSGDASGTSASVNVTMSSNKAVTANFTAIPVTYTLSTTASPSAGGTVTGAGTYNSGTVATVTATANAGYTFTGWSGDASGSATSTTVTMNGNKSVTANFQLSGGGNTTIRIEDDATTAQGLCLYEGSISSNSGANNGKVINLTNSVAKGVNWRVQVPTGGTYTLVWRYVNSSTSNTYAMALIINGVTVNASQPFAKTSSSSVFATSSASVNLNAGYNLIRLESIASNATADIDWIEITGNSPVAANCSASRPSVTANDNITKASASIYPNPVKEKAVINFSITQNEKITIKVYDNLGRLIENKNTKMYYSGNNQVELNFAGRACGVYTVMLSGNMGTNKVLKVVAN